MGEFRSEFDDLLVLVLKEKDEKIRKTLAYDLIKITRNNRKLVEKLKPLLLDPNEETRAYVLEALDDSEIAREFFLNDNSFLVQSYASGLLDRKGVLGDVITEFGVSNPDLITRMLTFVEDYRTVISLTKKYEIDYSKINGIAIYNLPSKSLRDIDQINKIVRSSLDEPSPHSAAKSFFEQIIDPELKYKVGMAVKNCDFITDALSEFSQERLYELLALDEFGECEGSFDYLITLLDQNLLEKYLNLSLKILKDSEKASYEYHPGRWVIGNLKNINFIHKFFHSMNIQYYKVALAERANELGDGSLMKDYLLSVEEPLDEAYCDHGRYFFEQIDDEEFFFQLINEKYFLSERIVKRIHKNLIDKSSDYINNILLLEQVALNYLEKESNEENLSISELAFSRMKCYSINFLEKYFTKILSKFEHSVLSINLSKPLSKLQDDNIRLKLTKLVFDLKFNLDSGPFGKYDAKMCILEGLARSFNKKELFFEYLFLYGSDKLLRAFLCGNQLNSFKYDDPEFVHNSYIDSEYYYGKMSQEFYKEFAFNSKFDCIRAFCSYYIQNQDQLKSIFENDQSIFVKSAVIMKISDNVYRDEVGENHLNPIVKDSALFGPRYP